MYPEYAEINGKKYKIDTSFETALKCFEIANDKTITDYEKVNAIVYLLFDFIPKKNIVLFFKKAIIYLQCGQDTETQNSKKHDMDFIQDRKYINSSFMSDYHIDLSKEKLHFWQFIELIEGLSENCSLNRIRDIRNFDLSKEKDSKKRNEIIEAKKRYALKSDKKEATKEQKASADEFYKNLKI